MKKFTFFLLCLFTASMVWSQTARVQIIHNSPTPTVDIWVNGEPFLTDFEFRTATPYVDVPADVMLDIGVAPSPSTSPNDIIANFPAMFESGKTYAVLASGIVGNVDTPFTLNVVSDTREAATSDDVDFIINHGSPDAPAVDIMARNVATLAEGAAYGDVTDYITVPPAEYMLDITPSGDQDEIVASYTADLSGLGGGAAVVFASGFLAPATPDDPAFGVFAALPDGTVVEFPSVDNTARVQIIHNSPTPTVDIWVNNEPFLTDFDYRTATPFVDVPAGTTLNIGVAPSPSSSPNDIIATFPVNFAPEVTYTVFATGIVGNADTPFDLIAVSNAREAATSGDVDFKIHHGSTDAPAVDVIARGVATLAEGAAYGDVTDYISVPAADYTIDITPAGNNDEIVASYTAPLSGLGGGSATVFASGFLAPMNMDDPAFGLFAALPDGTVLELPSVTNTARLQIIHNSPSPTVDIWVNNEPFLTDFEYRTATPFVDVPAGTTLEIGVAPSPSTSPNDIIATFPINFAPERTYTAIATGIVGNADTPFDLIAIGDTREAATSGDVDFIVNHGSTDAPAVDVIARGVATLVSGAAYGDVTDYITVPAGDYTLDITPAGNNDEIVASYTAPLSGLGGGAATVFASGFLAPANMDDPAFGLFAALPDGTVLELPSVVNTARVQIIHNSASPTVDIWVNNEPFLTDFEYRTATPFVDVPAGTTLEIGVAPSPSTSPNDIIATFPVNFAPERTYTAIATGIVGNADTPFDLIAIGDTREAATSGDVDFIVNHGSTDAPAVDVIARGVATLVSGAAYGDVTDYITVPAGDYTLDITPAGNNDEIVASYTAPLSGLGGGAATVFASGFLAPANMDDPAFGLFAALPDGTVLELPSVVNTARVQIIHNSASPTVDIWVNNEPFLTDFEYRTATPFVDVPAGTTLDIGVAPSPSTSPNDIIANFPVNFAPDRTYTVIATGIVGNADTPFDLIAIADTREAATSGDVDFIVNHGSTDAPAVDVIARDVATLVSGAAYGDVTDYITVPAGDYTLDITPAGQNSEIVASYTAPLSGLGGGAATVFASGFLAPANIDDPAFGLFAALPDGTVLELPLVVNTARVQIIHNSASPTVDIWVNNEPFLTDFAYRTATAYVDVPAGRTLDLGVAPSPSTSPDDIIANFDVNFTPNQTYVVIASGLVGNADTPFTLNVFEGAREAGASGDVDFIVNHGSTDAPAVDVIARDVATLVSGAEYGDITDYITVPAGTYILDITPAGQSDIVASFNADLSGLGGGSAVVFASGFLTPGPDDPAFGLWVSLADGTTFPLGLISSTNEAVEIEGLNIFPNPTSDVLQLDLEINETTQLDLSLIDLSGKQMFNRSVGTLTAGEYRETVIVSDVIPGTYILMIKTETGMAARKVTIE